MVIFLSRIPSLSLWWTNIRLHGNSYIVFILTLKQGSCFRRIRCTESYLLHLYPICLDKGIVLYLPLYVGSSAKRSPSLTKVEYHLSVWRYNHQSICYLLKIMNLFNLNSPFAHWASILWILFIFFFLIFLPPSYFFFILRIVDYFFFF